MKRLDWKSVDDVEYKVRCHVNGTTKDRDGRVVPRSAHWSYHYQDHPWVQQAERQGWSRELRAVVICIAMQRYFRGDDWRIVEGNMPAGDWIKKAVEQAEVAAMATEWRKENAAALQGKGRSTFGRLPAVKRSVMTDVQSRSPNRELHRQPRGLTRSSRAMAGDFE